MTYLKQGFIIAFLLAFLFGCATDPGNGVPLAGGARTYFTYEKGDVRVKVTVSGPDIQAIATLADINADTGTLEDATDIEDTVSIAWPEQLTVTLPDCAASAQLLNSQTNITNKVYNYHYPDSCGSTPSVQPLAQISIVVSKPSLPNRTVNGGSSSTPNSQVSISTSAATAYQTVQGVFQFANIDLAKTDDGNKAEWIRGTTISYGYSYHLYLTGYFSANPIPDSAVIEGVKVNCMLRGVNNSGDDSFLSSLRLVKTGVAVGANRANMYTLPIINILSSDFGGNSDLWGTTLTGADINQGSFGIQIQLEGGLDVEAYLDYCKLSIYWH